MKVILLLTMCLSLFACGNKNTKGSKAQEQQPPKDHVEVLYFHGKQRCITCAAIEKKYQRNGGNPICRRTERRQPSIQIH